MQFELRSENHSLLSLDLLEFQEIVAAAATEGFYHWFKKDKNSWCQGPFS